MSAPGKTPEAAIRFAFLGVIIFALASVFEVTDLEKILSQTGIKIGKNELVSNKTEPILSSSYKVTKIVDGDTIHVNINGVDEKIRFIGINTPETVDPRTIVQCFGKEASDRMKELAKGKYVRLEYDESQATRDTYGRILAYVYLEDGQMLNRKMIAEGYAYEYTYITPYKYQKEFRELQKFAQVSGRGLWSENTCNGEK